MGKKILIFLFSILIAIWFVGFKSNVDAERAIDLKIPTNTTLEQFNAELERQLPLKNKFTFKLMMQLLSFRKVKSGLYEITPNMSNWKIIRKLKSGNQTPVNFVLNSIVLKEQLASKIASNLELDSIGVYNNLTDPQYCEKLGYNSDDVMTLFIPNTYQLYWNISFDDFVKKMQDAHHIFWNEERLQKAAALNLKPSEVYIIASLVQKEYSKKVERSKIAGVIYNRLQKGMALQIDATCVYATRDFTARRVNETHLNCESPYNTYKKVGLPPGPICMPEISTIDAVLDLEKHNYMFYCANPELNGYHLFSETYGNHVRVARTYQKKLNEKGIH